MSSNESEMTDEELQGVEKPCLKCQTDISALAEKCPYCGYEPGNTGDLTGKIMIGLGIILCLTFAGAIVGIPLIIAGYWSIKNTESEKRPTNTAP